MLRKGSLFDLEGKVAIVTGAASGLGRRITTGLANAGASVVVADINVKAAEEAADKIRRIGRESRALGVDVTSSDQVNEMTEKVMGEFGRIDVLINSAGIVKLGTKRTPMVEMSEEQWDAVIKVNLKGTFLCAQRVAREMIKQKKGKIVNIASMSGVIVNRGVTGIGSYCVSKAGVIMLTKALAVEWAKYNINVNCISPGYMKTPLTAQARSDPEISRIQLDMTPFHRYGEPDEVVGAAILLASDASSYMTGSNLVVDGGHTVW